MHIRDKDKAKPHFLNDQNKSKNVSSFICASFDFQKVLNTTFTSTPTTISAFVKTAQEVIAMVSTVSMKFL